MKTLNRSQYSALIIFSLMTLMVIFFNLYNKKQLKTSFLHTKGKVVKLSSGGNSGSVHFRFGENIDAKRDNNMRITWPSCRSLIRKELFKIQRLEFPVVYSPQNLDNAEILIFEDQYEKFGVEIPDEVSDMVKLLSECMN